MQSLCSRSVCKRYGRGCPVVAAGIVRSKHDISCVCVHVVCLRARVAQVGARLYDVVFAS